MRIVVDTYLFFTIFLLFLCLLPETLFFVEGLNYFGSNLDVIPHNLLV